MICSRFQILFALALFPLFLAASDSHAHEFKGNRRAQAAHPDEAYLGIAQFQLAVIADIGQNNLPRVGIQFLICEFFAHFLFPL